MCWTEVDHAHAHPGRAHEDSSGGYNEALKGASTTVSDRGDDDNWEIIAAAIMVSVT